MMIVDEIQAYVIFCFQMQKETVFSHSLLFTDLFWLFIAHCLFFLYFLLYPFGVSQVVYGIHLALLALWAT